MTLTWEQVRARSEQKLGNTKCFCFDCYLCFEAIEMPCLKHCESDEEVLERDVRIVDAMRKACA